MKSTAKISGSLRCSVVGVNEEIAEAKILLSHYEVFTNTL